MLGNKIQFYINICLAINCVWNAWAIGTCSKTCGTGTRTNTRTKQVEESNGGSCTGSPTMTEICNQHECPGNDDYM